MKPTEEPNKETVAAIDAVFQGDPKDLPHPPPPAHATEAQPPAPMPPAEPGAEAPHESPLGDHVRELGQEFQDQEDASTL